MANLPPHEGQVFINFVDTLNIISYHASISCNIYLCSCVHQMIRHLRSACDSWTSRFVRTWSRSPVVGSDKFPEPYVHRDRLHSSDVAAVGADVGGAIVGAAEGAIVGRAVGEGVGDDVGNSRQCLRSPGQVVVPVVYPTHATAPVSEFRPQHGPTPDPLHVPT